MNKLFYTISMLLIFASCKTIKETKPDDVGDKKIIKVIINPIIDESGFITKESRSATSSNPIFIKYLVKDLSANFANNDPLKFYTKNQAVKENIQPNWIVDLTLIDIYVAAPISFFVTRYRPIQVATGRDTGRTSYTATYGNEKNVGQKYTATVKMEVRVTDVKTRNTVFFNTITGNVDWDVIQGLENNSQYRDNQPTKEQILNNISRNLYPQIKENIIAAVAF